MSLNMRRAVVLAVACVGVAGGSVWGQAAPATLPEGVAAGETTQTSTLLWARSTAGDVTFNVYSDAALTNLVATVPAAVADANEPVKAAVSGLTPNTRYYYSASNASNTATGTFKTFAAPGQTAGLSFGVTGDWRGENAPYPAVKNVAGKNLDFFVALGDTIYGDVASNANNGQRQAQTVDEYRNKYKEVYGTTNGQNVFAGLRSSTSTFAVIDDHEVTNDFAGFNTVSNDARFTFSNTGSTVPGTTPLNQTDLYRNGLQAFQEFHPISPRAYAGVAGPDAARFNGVPDLYRSQRFGNDAQLIVTDLRSFRDTELNDQINPADTAALSGLVVASLAQTNRTLFGKTQLERVKADLLAAKDTRTWKFVEVGEVFQNLGPVGSGDRAEGYSAERNELLKFIDDNKIENVVFISADIHGSFVNGLEYQTLTPSGIVHRQTSAIEISTGSVGYSKPAGPTLLDLANAAPGLLPPGVYAAYNNPATPDFVREIILQGLLRQQTNALGYNPIGLLDDNAAGRIRLASYNRFDLPADAVQIAAGALGLSLQDAAVAVANTAFTNTTTFGWTQFTIDPVTQNLTMEIYGIPWYGPFLNADGTPGSVPAPDYNSANPVLLNRIVLAPNAIPEPSGLAVMAMAVPVLARRRR